MSCQIEFKIVFDYIIINVEPLASSVILC